MFKCYLLGSQLLGGYWLSFLFAKVYNLCIKVVYNLTKKLLKKYEQYDAMEIYTK